MNIAEEQRIMKVKEMEQHVTVLAVLHIAWSALGLLVAVIVFTAVTGGGMLSGDIEVMTVTTTIGSSIAFILSVINLPGLIGGVALLKRRGWGRLLTLIVGFMQLLYVPFGTVLGIYTIWVLLSDKTRAIFEDGK